jgi:hypothetical protein
VSDGGFYGCTANAPWLKPCADPGLDEAASRELLMTLSDALVSNLDTSSLHPRRGGGAGTRGSQQRSTSHSRNERYTDKYYTAL